MQKLIAVILFLSIPLLHFPAQASPTYPVDGVDFLTLDKSENPDASEKTSVVEFFAYFCRHCYAFESPLKNWINDNNKKIDFKRVHVSFGDATEPQQRLYYALEHMGKTDELHNKILNEIHVNRRPLNTEPAIADFMEKNGYDKAQFLNVYHSALITEKMRRAEQLQAYSKIGGVPTMMVGGRYLTSGGFFHKNSSTIDHLFDIFKNKQELLNKQEMIESTEQSSVLQVMDYLIKLNTIDGRPSSLEPGK